MLPPESIHHIQGEIDQQVADRLSPAVGVAVSVDGGAPDSLSSGSAGAGSLFRAFSCGKPLAAAVLWRLHDRGLVDWNAPVAEYWPEFASNGKHGVTVDHVLTHRAGLPSDPQVPHAAYGNWEQVVAYLEDAPLEFKPGERMEYHALTFGWLVGEIASRVAGRSFAEAFEDEVANPLGLRDTSFAPPPSRHSAVLALEAAPDFEAPGFISRFDHVLARQMLMPGGSCISTPRDMARFYSALLCDGMVGETRWLSSKTVREVTAQRAEAVDPETGVLTRRTLGMALPGVPPNTYACPWESQTFGHGGAGTSTTWGDPSTGIAAAVLNTGLQPRSRNRDRLYRTSLAIREAARVGG
jgi:CubicO group peptidase (beta-lactamase class C family)